ncbi:GDP-mannose 4,6-dehydratase [subsurface metagenome]
MLSLYSSKTVSFLVEVDPRYYRTTEVESLMGDYSKAEREFCWEPKVKFEEFVKIMVKADWEKAKMK